jgi:centromeric protein E
MEEKLDMGGGSEERISVCVRVRPMRSAEDAETWRADPANGCVSEFSKAGKPVAGSQPTFDKVYGGKAESLDVFESVGRRVVDSVVDGINGTIFAYGQTASGKTHTIHGDAANPGLLPLAIQQIFRRIDESPDRDFLVRISYVEIYRETIRDLLVEDTPTLKLRDTQNKITVGAQEIIITEENQIMEYMHTASGRRQVAATAMNDRSSRSHTIFRVIVESKLHGRKVRVHFVLRGTDHAHATILVCYPQNARPLVWACRTCRTPPPPLCPPPFPPQIASHPSAYRQSRMPRAVHVRS